MQWASAWAWEATHSHQHVGLPGRSYIGGQLMCSSSCACRMDWKECHLSSVICRLRWIRKGTFIKRGAAKSIARECSQGAADSHSS